MLKDRAKILAAETLTNLRKDLLETPRETPLTAEEVSALIHKTIENAYAQCINHEERAAYYKAVAPLIHSDRFKTAYPELYNYLAELNLNDEPFKETEKMYHNFVQAEEDKKFLRNAFSNPKIFMERLYDNPLINNLRRYVFPVNIMIWVLYGAVVLALGTVAIVAGILIGAASLGIIVVNAVVNRISNFITDARYDEAVDEYKAGKFAEYKSAYLTAIKETMMAEAKNAGNEQEATNIHVMDNDDFWVYMIEQNFKKQKEQGLKEKDWLSEEDIESLHFEQIKRTIPVSSIDRIKFSFKAYAEAITFPLSEVDGGMAKLGSVLARSFRIIAAPFVFAAIIIPELVQLGLWAAANLVDVVLLVVNYSTLVILNLPLDLYDFLKDLTNMLFKSNVKNNEFTKSPAMATLFLEYRQDKEPTSTLKEDKEPKHFKSPFETASVLQQDVEEHIEMEESLHGSKCDM